MIKKLIVVLCIIFLCKSSCLAYNNSTLGLGLERNNWGIIIKTVEHNSPASKNNLLSGDYILEVNGTNVTKMSFNDFCYFFNKRSEKPVNLLIRRSDDVFSVRLEPLSKWQNFLNRLSNKIISNLETSNLPAFFSSEYKVVITKNKVESKLTELKYSKTDIVQYDDSFVKQLITNSVETLRPLPDSYDEAVIKAEISRDGINDYVNLSLVSLYKKPAIHLFDDLTSISSFIDVFKKLNLHNEIKEINMTCVYKGPVPVNNDELKNSTYTNLKGVTNPKIIGELLDKTATKYEMKTISFMTKFAEVKQISACPEIFIEAFPINLNGKQFKAVFRFKSSKGFYFKYPQNTFVTLKGTVYPYYLSDIKLLPYSCDNFNTENFIKSLYSSYKKRYPDLRLEKIDEKTSLSRKTCYQLEGKNIILEIIPSNYSNDCSIIYYNLIDIKSLNKDYYKFMEKHNLSVQERLLQEQATEDAKE